MTDPLGLFGGGGGLIWKDGQIRSIYEIDPKQQAEAAQRERAAREEARKNAEAYEAARRAVNPHVYYANLHSGRLGYMSAEQRNWSIQYNTAKVMGGEIPPPPTLGLPDERSSKIWMGGQVDEDFRNFQHEAVMQLAELTVEAGVGLAAKSATTLMRMRRGLSAADDLAEGAMHLRAGRHAPKDPVEAQRILDETVTRDFPGFSGRKFEYNPDLRTPSNGPVAGLSTPPNMTGGPKIEIGPGAFGATPSHLRYTITHEELHHYLWSHGVGKHHKNPLIDKWMDDFVGEVFESRGWTMPPLK